MYNKSCYGEPLRLTLFVRVLELGVLITSQSAMLPKKHQI